MRSSSQLNRGAALIASQDEREELAGLNLTAGKRAKASTAYASALAYFTAGAALLAEDRWERRHELAFSLEINRAECEFLTSQFAAAEQRLAALSTRAPDTMERASIACLRVDLYMTLAETGRARRRRSRLPPAFGHRLAAASARRGSAARIRPDLGSARGPRDRGTHRPSLDERSSIACDYGCSDQARAGLPGLQMRTFFALPSAGRLI